MVYVHEDEKVAKHDLVDVVLVVVDTPTFTLEAVQGANGMIIAFIDWRISEDVSLSSHSSWEDVRTGFDMLVRAASL